MENYRVLQCRSGHFMDSIKKERNFLVVVSGRRKRGLAGILLAGSLDFFWYSKLQCVEVFETQVCTCFVSLASAEVLSKDYEMEPDPSHFKSTEADTLEFGIPQQIIHTPFIGCRWISFPNSPLSLTRCHRQYYCFAVSYRLALWCLGFDLTQRPVVFLSYSKQKIPASDLGNVYHFPVSCCPSALALSYSRWDFSCS